MKTLRKVFTLFMAIAYVIPVWGDSNNSSSDSTVSSKPIIIHKTKDVPVKLAPSKGLEAVMIFDVVKVTFRFPFDFWPAYVEISGEGSTYVTGHGLLPIPRARCLLTESPVIIA